jgi:hypothetical protein
VRQTPRSPNHQLPLAHDHPHARSLKGNSSIAPGCRASGDPGSPPQTVPEACRASLERAARNTGPNPTQRPAVREPAFTTPRVLKPHGKTADGAVLQVKPRPTPSALPFPLSPLPSLGPRPPDPTALAAVGESDRRLVRGPAARVPPLPRNDSRCSEFARLREGVGGGRKKRVRGVNLQVGASATRTPSTTQTGTAHTQAQRPTPRCRAGAFAHHHAASPHRVVADSPRLSGRSHCPCRCSPGSRGI